MSIDSSQTNPVDFFQYSTDLTALSEHQWNHIRRIAKELFAAGMFEKDQFKIAVEAYHRWLALTQSNEDLVDKMYGKIPGMLQ